MAAAPPAAQVQGATMAPFRGQRKLQPGLRVKVGAHIVTVQRFLSQGGFAHVYLAQADTPVRMPGQAPPGDTHLVLKHMCVWNKEALATVRAEVEHHVSTHRSDRSVHCKGMPRSCTLSKPLLLHW